MADQDQKKKKKSKKIVEFSLDSISPTKVYCDHLVTFTITGSGFNKKTWRSLLLEGGKIEGEEFISDSTIKLIIRIDGGTTDGELELFVNEDSDDNKLIVTTVSSPLEDMSVIPQEESDIGEYNKGDFCLGLFEISNREYLEFLNYLADSGDHSKCHPDEPENKDHVPDNWESSLHKHPDMPVMGVDWYDAYAYAHWKGFRLPSAEEWIAAGSGSGGSKYPWGDEVDLGKARTVESGTDPVLVNANPTGRSHFGLFNLSGNAWEWMSDSDGQQALVKGGSFRASILESTLDNQEKLDKTTRRIDVGFRCAADLTEEIWAAKKEEEEERLQKELALEQALAGEEEDKITKKKSRNTGVAEKQGDLEKKEASDSKEEKKKSGKPDNKKKGNKKKNRRKKKDTQQ